jgi:hypothetical protein
VQFILPKLISLCGSLGGMNLGMKEGA